MDPSFRRFQLTMTKPVITVENLSKAYRIGLKDEIPDTLVSAMSGLMKAPFRKFRDLRKLDTFGHSGADEEDIYWALKDVSFEVQEGEVLGVIGRNGAGKSTLLKILSRITEPTSGRAVIRGRVSSLLEVGTGFHPELSGRENVYLNGTILGMTKREIDRKFDEIVDFSGVEKFLDTPIKRYSSGMKVRLAFAVAAHLEPEILIIDEVLAVGDAEFQKKCMGKMQDVAKGGRTVLFVSHNMSAIDRLCSSALLLARGSVSLHSSVTAVVGAYNAENSGPRESRYVATDADSQSEVALLSATLLSADNCPASTLRFGEPFSVAMKWQHDKSVANLSYSIRVYNATDSLVCAVNTIGLEGQSISSSGQKDVLCRFEPSVLAPGAYRVAIGAYARPYGAVCDVGDCIKIDVVPTPFDRSRSFTAAGQPACAPPVRWEVCGAVSELQTASD
jgi:lipopolysaccharide transport system ATP-binding protein